MPNTTSGLYSGTTRKELCDLIRDQLRMYADTENDPPERTMFDQVGIRNLWPFIKRHGSSTAHFRIEIGGGEEIAFHGLTEEEFNEQERAEENA